MRELEHQAREAEEMYMRGIEEQQEYEQDEVRPVDEPPFTWKCLGGRAPQAHCVGQE